MKKVVSIVLLLVMVLAGFATVGDGAFAGPQWVHNVTGGGKDLYPGDDVIDFLINFNARVDAEGNTAGYVEWKTPEGNLIRSGNVDCLEVRGNQAFVRFVHSAGFTLIGFEDNGEGDGAAPDRHTYIYGGLPEQMSWATCQYFADNIAGLGGFPVLWVRGNVQVR